LNAFVNQKLYIKLKDTSDTEEHTTVTRRCCY